MARHTIDTIKNELTSLAERARARSPLNDGGMEAMILEDAVDALTVEEYQPILEEHKDGRKLQLISRNQFILEPPRVGWWNEKLSRWQVDVPGEQSILYGTWAFTHQKAVS